MRPQVAIVTRELHPFVGGGIAPILAAQARMLSADAQVRLFIPDMYRDDHARLQPDYGDGVGIEFVPEPEERGHFYTRAQGWSANVFTALLAAYGDRGPDLV